MLSEELDKQGEAAYNAYQAARKRAKEAGLTAEEALNDEEYYNAWKTWTTIAPLIIANGGEEVPYKDPLHNVYNAIRKHCITWGVPRVARIHLIPGDYLEEHPHTLGLYREKLIMINKGYYQEHGIDEDVINTMFHEMIHFFCDYKIPEKQIKDTDGLYHLPAFKETCEQFGGVCNYRDSEYGYTDASLTPEKMELVKSELKGV